MQKTLRLGAILGAILILMLGLEIFSNLSQTPPTLSKTIAAPLPLNATSPTPSAAVSNEAKVSFNNPSSNSYTLLATNSIATGHNAPVNAVAFAPDSQTFVTASADTLLKLWQVGPNAQTLCTFYNYPFPLVAVAFAPDGKSVATGDTGGGLKLWSLPCGTGNAQPVTLARLQGSIRTVAFSPDGTTLASGGSDNILRLWDLTSKQAFSSYYNGRYGINDLRWSPDGTQLAFVSTSGQLTLLKLGNRGKQLQLSENRAGPGGALRSVAWSPNGHWLAAGDQAGGVTVWDSQRPNISTRFVGASNTTAVHALAFSPDSTSLAEGAGDATAKLWEISSEADGIPAVTLGPSLSGHKSGVRGIAWSPDRKLLVSVSDDHTIRLWNATNGALNTTLSGSLSYQTSIKWSRPTDQVVSGAGDGKVRIWQTDTGQLAATLTLASNTKSITAVGLSPDGQTLAAISDNGLLGLWAWPAHDGQTPIFTTTVATLSLLAVGFSPDSHKVAIAGQDGKLRLWHWDGSSLQLLATSTPNLRPSRSLAFAPNGQVIATGSDDGQVRLWDSSTLAIVGEWSGHNGYIKTLDFNADGSVLGSAGGDGDVRLWNTATHIQQGGVQFPTVITALAWGADGQTLAAATDDGAIHLWHTDDNHPYFDISGSGLAALSLAFTTDGKRLAVVRQDGAMQIWSLTLSAADLNRAALSSAPLVSKPTSDFVGVQNNHLVLNGQRVKLKGFNFYPHLAPWGAMWQHWDGPQVATDLDKAQELGANSLRVLIPYGTGFEWTTADGTPNPQMLDELDQMFNLAATHNMRVLLTLYDFYGEFPMSGTPEEAANWQYLDALTARYHNDPRILGWDLHNEPDNYTTWQIGNQPQVLDWLERVALRVRQADPNHFVTVGFGNWPNFNVSGPDGVTPLALSDVASLHAYDPAHLDQQIQEVNATGGPLPTILEEFGWPSAPSELTADYSEAVQAQHYQASFDAIKRHDLDGALAWNLWDFTPDSILSLKPNIPQQFFGLVRLDGTLKPAATVWQQSLVASSLASSSGVGPAPALTIRGVDPNLYPTYFAATGYAVATPFKEYWSRLGGLTSFGYPISGVRLEGGFLVQYFERARFEYHPENTAAPDYAGLSRDEELKRIVLLGLLSREWLQHQGRAFPSTLPDPAQTFFPQTQHNLNTTFKNYWETQGGLARFGFPISEALSEVSATDSKTYLVQYFERARFEYHPDLAGTLYEVELGQLGRELLDSKH